MSFIAADGTVLLRVHQPGQFGDRLKRATYLQAAASGAVASGLEMGRNFFSLRCVMPVFSRGRLIGYLELGEEIGHIFEQMKEITGNDVSLLLKEDYLHQYAVDLPAVHLGGFAMLYPTSRQLTVQLATGFRAALPRGLRGFSLDQVEVRGERYLVGMSPIRDAFGTTAGLLFSQRNISLLHAAIWRGVAINLTVFLVILIVGNALLYVSLKRSLTLFQALRRHIQTVTRTWELSTPLEVTTEDEIGELAADLNRMQTEIAKLRRHLEQRAEELAAANQELESFSYTLSHDLRLPLTRVYSAAQMLQDGYAAGLDETGRFLIENICAGSEGMDDLIEAILVLAKVSRKEICRDAVDLDELVRGIAGELEDSEPDRQVTLQTTAGLVARGDAQLLRVALKNLMENAWKYTRPMERPAVEVGVVEEQGRRAFFVRDNGVGFDMTSADRLFTPFKRLHDAAEFPGTGIGLATVQRIILPPRRNSLGQQPERPGYDLLFYPALSQTPLAARRISPPANSARLTADRFRPIGLYRQDQTAPPAHPARGNLPQRGRLPRLLILITT